MTRAQLITEYEQLQKEHAALKIEKQHLEAQVNWFKEQIRLGQHRQFGSSSEKMSALLQTELLFNEAEATLDSTPAEAEPETITYTRKPKQAGHREKMLADLPMETIEYRLTEEEQTCSQCGGHMHEMGTQIREEIEFIPAQAKVVRHIQSVYGCRNCEKNEINVPIYNRMHELLLGLDILHADETPLQVLKEPGRSAQEKSYLWLYRSGRYSPPIICYEYQPGRGGEYPVRFLNGFAGRLHADGWHAYDNLKDVKLIGCWAHVRRYFVDALVVVPKDHRSDPELLANIAVAKIEKLYEIEKELHDASPEDRLAVRQMRSKPIVDDFKEWLDKEFPFVLPQSVLGKAFTYCRNQWPKLIRFLEDGRLEPDNNRAERSIKPFVIGRKNWLFANTPRGALTSAIIYSIVETAKENGLNPFDYLKFVFERIKMIDLTDPFAIDSLLPWSEVVQTKLKIQPPHAPANTLTA